MEQFEQENVILGYDPNYKTNTQPILIKNKASKQTKNQEQQN